MSGNRKMVRGLRTGWVGRFTCSAWLVVPVLGFLCARVGLTQETYLVAIGEEWDYLRGTAEPPSDWNTISFPATGWLRGPTGIGYGDGDDTTELLDMQNGYQVIYCRRLFEMTDAGAVEELALRIDYDDGFVAYLNGTEVARSSNMGTPGTSTPITFVPTVDHEAGLAELFPIDAGLLEDGENLLAVQVHNVTLGSSDLSFLPDLVVSPSVCPTALSCTYDPVRNSVGLAWTPRATYDLIEVYRNGELLDSTLPGTAVTFDDTSPLAGEATYELVASTIDTECDPIECSVTVPESVERWIDVGDEWTFFRGTLPPPIDWTDPEFDDSTWEFGPTGIGYGDGDDATVLSDMQNSYLTVFCRYLISPDRIDNIQRMTFSVVYDDGIVLYVNNQEVARANMPAGAVFETTAAVTAGEPTVASFDIPVDLLDDGDNAIAVSVHNANLTSSDLSFIPVLTVERSDAGSFRFRRGDASNDSFVNLTDAVTILNHLFRGVPITACLDAGDVDDNGSLALTDAVSLLNTLFRGAGDPPPPGRQCGVDPTDDLLGSCSSTGCQ